MLLAWAYIISSALTVRDDLAGMQTDALRVLMIFALPMLFMTSAVACLAFNFARPARRRWAYESAASFGAAFAIQYVALHAVPATAV